MPDARAELVRRYFEAVRTDHTQTARLYAPDATLHYVGRHVLGGVYRGPQEIMELFRRSREAFRGTQRLELHDVVASGDIGGAWSCSTCATAPSPSSGSTTATSTWSKRCSPSDALPGPQFLDDGGKCAHALGAGHGQRDLDLGDAQPGVSAQGLGHLTRRARERPFVRPGHVARGGHGAPHS